MSGGLGRRPTSRFSVLFARRRMILPFEDRGSAGKEAPSACCSAGEEVFGVADLGWRASFGRDENISRGGPTPALCWPMRWLLIEFPVRNGGELARSRHAERCP